jgi:F-type H+-transporting ATPase subunit delta
MIEDIVVKRYAEAFVDFARGTIGLDRALDDCKALKSIMRDNPEFQDILHNPQIPYAEKSNFIDKIMAADFSGEFVQFIKLLLEKRRTDKISDIAEYVRINYAHRGEKDVVLKTSLPLDLELIQQLRDKIEKKLHKKFRFFIDLDGDLLGGVKVISGNTVIDGSVRRRLDELKEKLRAVRI